MYRALCSVIVLLVVISPVEAGEGKNLTNAELKEMTSEVLFVGGSRDLVRGFKSVNTMFPNGSLEILWTNGVSSEINKGKWWIDGDLMCLSNEKYYAKRCEEWRKNGDRIETWNVEGMKTQQGYFYILD
jgi:hypothetical protein